MDLKEKLNILANIAKYDASCSSSGSTRKNNNGIGKASFSGIFSIYYHTVIGSFSQLHKHKTLSYIK